MKIIGHHTCSSEGDSLDEIEAPFYSTHNDKNPDEHKFLGSGYYFWDNNTGIAHHHGQRNYKRKYYIFEAELEIVEDDFLDLAGNRIDMLNFQEIIKELQENKDTMQSTKNWTIAHFIEFLKTKQQFPYRAVRAIDTRIQTKEAIKFVANRNNFTNLNPIFIVCLQDIEKDMLKNFKHIKTFP